MKEGAINNVAEPIRFEFFDAVFTASKSEYKESYYCSPEDLNVLPTIRIEMAPKQKCHKGLKSSLSFVRNQLKFQNLYYKPTYEEMKDGDVCHIVTSWGMSEGVWPSILIADTHINLFCDNLSLEGKFLNADIYKPSEHKTIMDKIRLDGIKSQSGSKIRLF